MSVGIGRARKIQARVEIVAEPPGKLGRDAHAVMRRQIAVVVGRFAAARRGVDVQLEAPLAALVEIVCVDLDLVHDRERFGPVTQTGAQQQRGE